MLPFVPILVAHANIPRPPPGSILVPSIDGLLSHTHGTASLFLLASVLRYVAFAAGSVSTQRFKAA